MSLPIYQRVAVTDAGDVIPGAEYTVINENTGVAAPIYSDRTGATLLTAPYFADSAGTIQFYIAAGTTFRVAASGGVGTYTDRYIYAAHPQSNPTDTTSGSLMAVGAGGLLHLGNSGLIAAATLWPNASLLDVTGVAGGAMYGVLGITNSPANADGSVFVFYQSSVRVQIIFYDRASPRIWFNQSYNSGVTFQGWNEVITANAAGNVGIGTISPTFKLDVAGNARASYFAIRTNEAAPVESAFMYRPSTGVLGFGVTSAEKMRIDSSGNVGINTISPSAPLQVVSGENLVAKFSSSDGTSGIRIEDTTTSYDFYVDNGNLRINNTAGSEKMRIDSAGNALFGCTSVPDGTNIGMAWAATGDQSLKIGSASTFGDYQVRFYNANGNVGNIITSGSSTAYATSSDYRLKEDDVPMTGATERVKALRPINFAWKASGSRVDGFFAHELAEVVPEAATGTKDAMMDEEYEVTPAVYEDVTTPAVEAVLDEDGVVITDSVEESTESVLVTKAVMATRSVPDYQGIDQSKLVPLLTATIQELIARIEALEAGA